MYLLGGLKALFLCLCNDPGQQAGNPSVFERLLRCGFRGRDVQITHFNGRKGNDSFFRGPLFSFLISLDINGKAFEGRAEQLSETSNFFVRCLKQLSSDDEFVEEVLRKVFGLLIIVFVSSKVGVDGVPIGNCEIVQSKLSAGLILGACAQDKRPSRFGQPGFCSPQACPIRLYHWSHLPLKNGLVC